jgi:DNA polymerase
MALTRHRRLLLARSERARGLGAVVVRRVEVAPPTIAPVIETRSVPRPSEAAVPQVAEPSPVLISVDLGPNRPPFDGSPQPRQHKLEVLAALDRDEVKPCRKCRLCETRKNTVFGVGDVDARLLFIGEGPGENEDLQGEPFVGKAGQLLDKMIQAMGWSRERVYIANIVKCRPPGNRVPAPDEVATCTPFLEKQIEVIRPQVIVTLGLPATQYMLTSKNTMSRMRGIWHAWRGIKLMPTYHPAYVLRQYTPEVRAAVWSDLQKVMDELKATSTAP